MEKGGRGVIVWTCVSLLEAQACSSLRFEIKSLHTHCRVSLAQVPGLWALPRLLAPPHLLHCVTTARHYTCLEDP
jgi:hypothetical protein